MNESTKIWLWRTAVTVAIIVFIFAGFYAEENGRGIHAWQKCEREIAARGESLEWTNFIPAPVPDGQNFYQAPSMGEWFVRSPTNGSSVTSLLPLASNPETQSNVVSEISASNYLAWSAAFEPQIDAIRNALKRPLVRMDGDYSSPFLQPVPNFVSYRAVVQVLAHRARCHLLLNEPDQALADLTLLHRLDMTLVKTRPDTLVTAMIHVAISGLYADTVACGIETRSWREPDLSALQKQLAEINLLPDLVDSFRTERAGICRTLDMATSQEQLWVAAGGTTRLSASDLGWWFMPSGWIYQNKALVVTLETQMIDCTDTTNKTVSPSKLKRYSALVEHEFEHTTPMNFMAAICIPNFTKANEMAARNQTMVDQDRIVCALERCRLVYGNYPAKLAVLVPHFIDKIPHDIINGMPMKYYCPDGQTFKLWSVGWNEIDDGGVTQYTSDGKEDRDFGDWVWHYPTF